jgi:hypothetical protein
MECTLQLILHGGNLENHERYKWEKFQIHIRRLPNDSPSTADVVFRLIKCEDEP